jgi:hypothetical protein
MRKLIALSFLILFIAGCGGGKHMVLPTTPENNGLGNAGDSNANKGTGPSVVSFYSTIKPLFEQKCGTCHGQGSAFGNWSDYNQVLLKKDRIYQRVVVKKDMPLTGKLDENTRKLIGKWINDGAIAGSPLDQPEQPISEPTPTEPAPSEPQPVDPQPPVDGTPTDPITPPAPEVPAPVTPAPVQPEPVAPTPPSTPTVPGAPSEPLTFVKDVKPLFDSYCALCHNAGSGDFMPNWSEYSNAYNKKDRIIDRLIVKRDMPLGVDMPESARITIKTWIEQGALFDSVR